MLISAGPTAPDGFAVGHEAVAEVVAVGPGVSKVAVGQLVFSSFQLCCGRCRACAGGRTANCAEYPVLSDYGMQPLSRITPDKQPNGSWRPPSAWRVDSAHLRHAPDRERALGCPLDQVLDGLIRREAGSTFMEGACRSPSRPCRVSKPTG